MSYKLLVGGGVQRLEDGACIPPTLENMDWVAYLAWLELGNVPQAQDPRPGPDSAGAMASRQRAEAVEALDYVISKLPAVQQEPFRLIQKLLEE